MSHKAKEETNSEASENAVLMESKSEKEEKEIFYPEVVADAGSYPELFAISLVYFVQGFVSLSSLAVYYFLKDILHQGPAQVEFLNGFQYLPWIVKPVYGFASDSVPLFGYRRRSYLMLCGLLGSFSWIMLGTSASTVPGTVILLVAASAGDACSDVVVDSIVVERVRGKSQTTAASLQVVCWASRALGGTLSAALSGYVVENFGPRFVFRSIAFFPLLVTFSAALVKEKPLNSSRLPQGTMSTAEICKEGTLRWTSGLRLNALALWSAFNQKRIYLPALFMFIYNASPNASAAMFFFETNELHFSPEFMGRVALIGQLASLAGVGIYNYTLKAVPLKKIFAWCCILSTVVGMSQLILISGIHRQYGLSDQLFVLGDSVILDVLGQIAFMPGLVLAARICPEGVEATLFALLMSIYNGGSVISNSLGAGLTTLFGVTNDNFTNLMPLTTLCLLSNLLSLAFLHLLPDNLTEEDTS